MPVLTNSKHEKFCQFRVSGKSQEEAYELAGYKPSRQHAHRLATRGYVQDRIRELQAITVELFEITTEMIAKQLDQDRANAIAWKQASAAVSASVAKGKLGGVFIDRSVVNVTHNYSLMTEEELRFELAALNAEARSLKPGVQH